MHTPITGPAGNRRGSRVQPECCMWPATRLNQETGGWGGAGEMGPCRSKQVSCRQTPWEVFLERGGRAGTPRNSCGSAASGPHER